MFDHIEILSIDLLDEQREDVRKLRALTRSLNSQLGWHYLLDLTWILKNLANIDTQRVLDAGAGQGAIQWFLAGQGVQVVSVDRIDRRYLSLVFRSRYRISGLRGKQDLESPLATLFHDLQHPYNRNRVKLFGRNVLSLARMWAKAAAPGKVLIYQQDLAQLSDIPDNDLDAVVSVSSLEHNPPDKLPEIVKELVRVLKPGGVLLATLGAARDQDWYHQPSKGWNYTVSSLKTLFDLPLSTPDNYIHFDDHLAALRECAELRQNLAGFYFCSGENGMPWGVWDPMYQPVGVCKIKPLDS